MPESVHEIFSALQEIDWKLTSIKEKLGSMLRLSVDEFTNENFANRTGNFINDATYKQSMKLLHHFSNIIDEIDTDYKTLCLVLPYIIDSSKRN